MPVADQPEPDPNPMLVLDKGWQQEQPEETKQLVSTGRLMLYYECDQCTAVRKLTQKRVAQPPAK